VAYLLILRLIRTGSGGSIDIFTQEFTIADSAKISVNSQGQGNGGNLSIQTNLFNLDQASVLASTVSGEGGNIALQAKDLLLMRNNSSISARAFNDANGGNLSIETNLIIAFPNGNNDIIANAQRGDGGNINITVDSLFGIEERPLNLVSNDINASSEFGLQGNIAINTPEVDPTSGLIELPQAVGDASDQISQNPCERGIGSEFIITGKGGLPPNVNESLNSESAQVGLIEAVPSQQQTVGANAIPPEKPTPEAVPAQGWVFNDKGEVTLTAYKTTNTGRPSFPKTPTNSCSAP
jgi:large exoprotein involved in heme utilization and adhesion